MEFDLQEVLNELDKCGVNRDYVPEEPVWRLLMAQKKKSKQVLSYVNFSSTWLLPKDECPPGLGHPDSEKEDDALWIPSYAAWTTSFRRWATVAVQAGLVTTDAVKLYEATIQKMVVGQSGNTRPIAPIAKQAKPSNAHNHLMRHPPPRLHSPRPIGNCSRRASQLRRRTRL